MSKRGNCVICDKRLKKERVNFCEKCVRTTTIEKRAAAILKASKTRKVFGRKTWRR
tara:strand:+ start:325 stop:492 length:168 start_codon:yes stop_codon:yes gene_type:complete